MNGRSCKDGRNGRFCGREIFSTKFFLQHQINKLKQSIQEGIRAQQIIVEYNDFLVTTFHPIPPADCNLEERMEETQFQQQQNNKHPVAMNLLQCNEWEDHYCHLIDTVEQHQCCSYCLKSAGAHKKCQGNFPIPLTDCTIIAIEEKKGLDDIFWCCKSCNKQ